MQSILAAEGDGGGSGAVQSGDQLLADVFRFSDSDHDDLLFLSERLIQSLDREAKTLIEAICETLELGDFDAKDGPGFFDEIHGERVPETPGEVNLTKLVLQIP